MIYCKGVLTTMILVVLFVLVSYCLAYDSVFALGELRCKAKEREALLRFKQGLIDEYGVLSSWGSEEDKKECCKWKGVECSNETSHVIGLRLSGEYGYTPFGGKISSALLELNYLNHLDLSYNDFGYDEIPKFIGYLEKLQYLNFTHSNFSGIVPDLRALVSLKELRLSSNKLKTLPASLGEVSMLEVLDVSFNSFEGTISDTDLSKLQNLKLNLSFNSLVLNFTANWIPPFQLHVIRLASCSLGHRFPTWLQTQTSFSELDLSQAGISDEVPKWLWDLSQGVTYLNLSFNQISGTIDPDMSSKLVGFPEIDISYNNFSGYLPSFHPNSLILQLSNNMFSGSISSMCKTYDSLWILDLSNNQLSGELPNCWENMKNLHMLILANNDLSGRIPHSLGSLRWLHALDLRNNNLSGELPSTFNNLRRLVMVDFRGNKLTGKIPAWIGHLKSLIVLSFGHNYFYGSIPIEICYLTEIQILDLSKNSISGNVPPCFNNYTSMVQKSRISDPISMDFGFNTDSSHEYSKYIDHALVEWKGQERLYTKTLRLLKLIDLSSNYLVGNIPYEFSHLIALLSLNLSRNSLSGKIISNIGEMEMLECLDLSRNQLFGEIPNSLAELNFLGVLNLSNNNLSGKIPSSTQLQGFNASVYAENSELCGYPLRSCPGDGPNSSMIDSIDEEDDGFITQEFIISLAFGFICGFWGVFGTLVIKNSWRNACFIIFNRTRDWLYVRISICVTRLKGSV